MNALFRLLKRQTAQNERPCEITQVLRLAVLSIFRHGNQTIAALDRPFRGWFYFGRCLFFFGYLGRQRHYIRDQIPNRNKPAAALFAHTLLFPLSSDCFSYAVMLCCMRPFSVSVKDFGDGIERFTGRVAGRG